MEPLCGFPFVDGILLGSHLQFLKLGLAEDGADHPFELGRNIFNWNLDPGRPVAYLDTPHGKPVPTEIRSLLGAPPLDELRGAEYHPSELVYLDQPVVERLTPLAERRAAASCSLARARADGKTVAMLMLGHPHSSSRGHRD